ncbi:hypothetical protein OIDMADRAFT_181831 [Oidiodendron maius Zn]|uniref:C2H2-type domain-containing protein n=1 Tax=Oidiodendron maius (strain Zn) TaxID=913774 RepID=A0A0C3H7R1_OIDMZ|nr:hypothetical protein OIDMADRAFT_181831 [Oidiodendron maius Zn]
MDNSILDTPRTSSPDDLRNALLPIIAPVIHAEAADTTQSTAKRGESSTQKFACPFFKYDPIKYGAQDKRRCDCIGWTDISRLKEHLTRSHAQKTYCPKCYREFPSVDGLYKHTSLGPCVPRSGRPPDGITNDVFRKLRSRKKNSRRQNDHEKWVEIYLTLFPNRQHVPSPYLEKPQGKMLVRLEDHEEYMRTEFQRLVDSRVEMKEVWKDKGELKTILGECLEETLKGYRRKSGLDFYGDDADVVSYDQTSTTQLHEPSPPIYAHYAAHGIMPQDGAVARLVCEHCFLENCLCRSSVCDGKNISLSTESSTDSITYMSDYMSPSDPWVNEEFAFNAENASI